MGICPISIDQYSTRNIIGIAKTGTGPWTYKLSVNNSIIGTYNTSKKYYIFIHQFTETGSNIPYMIDIVDSLGNHETDTCNITVNPGTGTALSVQLSINPSTITLNQSVTFTANVTGGLAPYSYKWANLPTPCSGTSNSITCVPVNVGTYNISITVTDSNNNTALATGTLVINPSSIPIVTSITPASGATGVGISTIVTAKFNEAMNTTTINTGTFLLKNTVTGTIIPVTVSYDNNTFMATLTSSSPLAYLTKYTAIVKGGTNGVKDISGNSMTADYTWFFTTKQRLYSIWSSSTVPGTVTDPDTSAVELGVKFRSDINGRITGIRFYKGPNNTGTHVGSIWTKTGTLLGKVTFSNETASGWQQANFATPIVINANTTYIASYHTNVGHYSVDDNYFATSGIDNPPLHALKNGVDGGNGIYIYNANSAFPNMTYLSSNYWVDLVFTE